MRIFISYAREDRAEVESLTGDLRGLGHDVWYDGELEGGQHWWDEILRGIKGCDVYVFALSEPALDSGPCLAELDYAQAAHRPLLPIQMQHVPASILPPLLADAHFVDYTAADKHALFKLRAAIESVPAPTPLPDPPPPPPVLPKSRLHDFKQQIDAPGELARSQQLTLVDNLAHAVHVKGQRADVVGLLRRFRDRPDVMADIRDRIDALVRMGEESGSATRQPDGGTAGAVGSAAGGAVGASGGAVPGHPGAAQPVVGSPPPQWSPPPHQQPAPAAQGFGPHPTPGSSGPWTSGFVVGMIAAGLFTCGIAPLVAGLTGYSDPSRRSQAITLLWVGGVILVLTILVGGSMSAQTTQTGY